MVRQNCDNCNVLFKSFFSRITKNDLIDLSERKSCISYKKGQTIFTSGTRPNGIYCLNKGKIKIYKTGAYGKEQIIRFALPGEFFGLRSVMCDKNYTSAAVTIEDSIVCFINKQDFNELLNKYPHITTSIITSLSEMLEDANNKVTSLAQKPVRERLAETLVTLNKVFKSESASEHTNTIISLSRQDLANMVGTATETIIRLLSELKNEHYISVKGRKITITDIRGLNRIANL
jgi:CRP/FNR family transcriptional regulator, polysaccharide utilization system transcription regulator